LVAKENAKKTKGKFLESIVAGSWYVINPATKSHCVADCLAVLKILRADFELVSIWSYIKKTGQLIADENNIRDGATVEQLKELSEKYQVDIVFNPDEERDSWECDAYLIV
jgi:hypothetical protein